MITNTVSNSMPVIPAIPQTTEICEGKTSQESSYSAPVDTFEVRAQAANLPASVVVAKRELLKLAKANTTNVEGIAQTRALMEPHLK